MPELSTEEIIAGISNGKPVTPFSIDEKVIDFHIELIRQHSMRLNTESALVRGMKSLTEEARLFVLPERHEQLNDCETYVLPLPVCLAYCEQCDGKNRIVIANGLIDLITHTMFLAHFEKHIPRHFEEFYLLKFPAKLSFIDLLINALFLLEYRFYRYGEALPNLRSYTDHNTLKAIRTSTSGAITFILLHELGHLALGHLENEIARPMTVTTAIPEQYNSYQLQELEADDFAANSLHTEAKPLATYWQHQAVAFYSQLELVSGIRTEDHPLAINRSAISDGIRGEIGQPFGLDSKPEHFELLKERFLATEKETLNRRNLLIETTRSGCFTVIDEISEVLAQESISLDKLKRCDWPSWISVFADNA